MLDQLFVARFQAQRFGGAGLAAGLFDTPRANSTSARRSDAISTGTRIEISDLSRRAAALERQLARISDATELVQVALKANDAVTFALQGALAIAASVDVGTLAKSGPVSAAGNALQFDAIDLTGTVVLADDVAASGFGDIALSAVSATGTQALAADAVATVTGDEDIASSNTLILQTSVSQSETLTIDAGDGVETITFGLFQGQVNSGAELEQAIDAIDGVSASYTVDGYLSIVGDDVDVAFTVGGTANVDAAFGIAEQTYSPVNLPSQGVAAGETLTFAVGSGSVQTITFGSGVGEVSTLAEFDAALSALTGVSAGLDGSNRLTFAADDVGDTVTLGGSVDRDAVFGLSQSVFDPRNLLQQGIAEGETLTFLVDGGAVQTITFGTGVGEVATVDELDAALSALSDITASVDGSDRISFVASDARGSVTVGGTADVAGVLGIAEQQYYPFNLLDQGPASGETLTLQVNGGTIETITFGTGSGEVATLAELAGALDGLSGLAASIDGQNRLLIAGSGANDTISVGGTADVQTAFGVAPGVYDPTALSALGIADGATLTFQIGEGTVETITFGAGGVATLSELDGALQAISGIDARIDESNRLTFTANDIGDTVTVGGSVDVETIFGLAPGAYLPVVTDTSALESLNAQLSLVDDEVADAVVDQDPNLIGGFTIDIRFSDRPGDSIRLGGDNLTLEALGVAHAGDAEFETESARAQFVGRIETALAQSRATAVGLKGDLRVLEARAAFAADAAARIDGAPEPSASAEIDLEAARRKAIETRKLLGQLALQRGLSGGAASAPGSTDAAAYERLAPVAFASSGNQLFSATNPLSSSGLARTIVTV